MIARVSITAPCLVLISLTISQIGCSSIMLLAEPEPHGLGKIDGS